MVAKARHPSHNSRPPRSPGPLQKTSTTPLTNPERLGYYVNVVNRTKQMTLTATLKEIKKAVFSATGCKNLKQLKAWAKRHGLEFDGRRKQAWADAWAYQMYLNMA